MPPPCKEASRTREALLGGRDGAPAIAGAMGSGRAARGGGSTADRRAGLLLAGRDEPRRLGRLRRIRAERRPRRPTASRRISDVSRGGRARHPSDRGRDCAPACARRRHGAASVLRGPPSHALSLAGADPGRRGAAELRPDLPRAEHRVRDAVRLPPRRRVVLRGARDRDARPLVALAGRRRKLSRRSRRQCGPRASSSSPC